MIRKRLLHTVTFGALMLGSMPAHAQYSNPIHDVDNPARQPVTLNATVTIPAGSSFSAFVPVVTVPAGKRLVIETISFDCVVQTGVGFLLVLTTTGPDNGTFRIPAVKWGTDSLVDYFIGLASLHAYGDPGTVVYLRTLTPVATTFGVNANNVTVTGYYVNLP